MSLMDLVSKEAMLILGATNHADFFQKTNALAVAGKSFSRTYSAKQAKQATELSISIAEGFRFIVGLKSNALVALQPIQDDSLNMLTISQCLNVVLRRSLVLCDYSELDEAQIYVKLVGQFLDENKDILHLPDMISMLFVQRHFRTTDYFSRSCQFMSLLLRASKFAKEQFGWRRAAGAVCYGFFEQSENDALKLSHSEGIAEYMELFFSSMSVVAANRALFCKGLISRFTVESLFDPLLMIQQIYVAQVSPGGPLHGAMSHFMVWLVSKFKNGEDLHECIMEYM